MKHICKKLVSCVIILALSGMLCLEASIAFADEGSESVTPAKITASDLVDGASGIVHAQKKTGRKITWDYGYYKWEYSDGCMTVNPTEGCSDDTRSEITAFDTTVMFMTDSVTGQPADTSMVKSLVIGDGFESVKRVQDLTSLESVYIGKDVTEIFDSGSPCFSRTLKQVVFAPDSKLANIGAGSFAGCEVETLDLRGCTELKKLGVFDGGGNSQAGQNGPFGNSNDVNEWLNTIYLPNSLEEIGFKAFSRCAKLENI